ncbi:MAG: sigma-54 dependent transcriptional regulator [Alphaproteobacteria bacterium]
MSDEANILVVEDRPEEIQYVSACLADQPFRIRHAATAREALDMLAAETPDAVLLDLGLPDMDGREVLRALVANNRAGSVVILTGNASLDTAVDAMRLGAFDYVVKPCEPARLVVTLRNAVERQRLAKLVSRFRERYESDHFQGFIGASPAMRAVYRTIESAAASTATIFITGESGTGKELCAAAIHALSARHDRPFVALNCAAIPAGLMESEIFGHRRGAFTGATAERGGAVARAAGGTLFLDEICDMPLDLQAKLLRVVQTGVYQKVGADQSEQADLRYVCATNRNPWHEVERGQFREDLFYRMHVIPIELPPLRERSEDIPLLAAQFLADTTHEESKHFAGFAPDAAAALVSYSWPGNVRELQNVIRRVVVLNDGEWVTAGMLPPLSARNAMTPSRVGAGAGRKFGDPASGVRALWQVERDAIDQAIAACGGNVRRAAALLGIDRATIYRKRRDARSRTQPLSSHRDEPLDAGILHTLEQALGHDTVRGLIERQTGDLRQRIAGLIHACEKSDLPKAAEIARDLERLAAVFGAKSLEKAALELAGACASRDTQRIEAVLPTLREQGERTLNALNERYAPDSAA